MLEYTLTYNSTINVIFPWQQRQCFVFKLFLPIIIYNFGIYVKIRWSFTLLINMKSFLFNPCDSSLNCENCFQLSNLNLLKSKIFRQTRKNDTLKISEPRYCSKVLHGNWFEERAENKPSRDEWKTSYDSLFKSHSNENFNITLENRAALKKYKERSKVIWDQYHN